MLELFIELTNQIFWDGYAQQLANENPAVFNSELNDFINNTTDKIMKDTVFLFIKVVIRTKYQHIQDAMKELETQTQYTIGSTENVEVLETEIIKLNKEQLNKNNNGTQS